MQRWRQLARIGSNQFVRPNRDGLGPLGVVAARSTSVKYENRRVTLVCLICLVCLVFLVCFVCLVYLDSQPDRPEKPDEPERPDGLL